MDNTFPTCFPIWLLIWYCLNEVLNQDYRCVRPKLPIFSPAVPSDKSLYSIIHSWEDSGCWKFSFLHHFTKIVISECELYAVLQKKPHFLKLSWVTTYLCIWLENKDSVFQLFFEALKCEIISHEKEEEHTPIVLGGSACP